MRVALAQLNPIVGDVAGNTRLVLESIERALQAKADLLVCPEMVLLGYPPRDLLFREGVIEACEAAVAEVARHAGDLAVIVGHPRRGTGERPFRNSASVCRAGEVLAVCDKRLLPGYDVFDDDRYFEPGDRPTTVEIDGTRVGLLICEDLWQAGDVRAERRYTVSPVEDLARLGCDLLVALNATPFVSGKWQRHLAQIREAVRAHRLPIVVVNQVGGNDDLVFDGRSVVVGADGALRAVLPGWEAAVETVDLSEAPPTEALARLERSLAEPLRELFSALVLGVKDYCRKVGKSRVVLGLSGGVDSALAASIATTALGASNVSGLIMPSRYSLPESRQDALALVRNLGLGRCAETSIEPAHRAVEEALASAVEEGTGGVTDENLQARLRGLLLMAFSNATGDLVLGTSNKSELATGYCTIYGDMCGALSVLGDVVKTRVYKLAEWINRHHADYGFAGPPIPRRSITKPPSAELRPDQTDQDTLPPYEVLDEIVERFIEFEQSPRRIVEETGFDDALVERTLRMIDSAQYKRDQAAVVLKVTGRTFGRGRPMPIAMKWEGARAGAQPPKTGEKKVLGVGG